MKFEGTKAENRRQDIRAWGLKNRVVKDREHSGGTTNSGHDLWHPQVGFPSRALGGEYRYVASHRQGDWALHCPGCACNHSIQPLKENISLFSKYCSYPHDSPQVPTMMPATGQSVEDFQATQKTYKMPLRVNDWHQSPTFSTWHILEHPNTIIHSKAIPGQKPTSYTPSNPIPICTPSQSSTTPTMPHQQNLHSHVLPHNSDRNSTESGKAES